MPVFCQVCNRPLRSQASQLVGMGPVCAKRVNGILQDTLQETAASGVIPNRAARLMEAIVAAQQAYRERIRRRRQRPEEPAPANVPEDRTISGIASATRGGEEEVQVEFSDQEHAVVRSASGRVYNTTATTCSCPHFVHRLQHSGGQCRHIQAFHAALEGQTTVASQTESSSQDAPRIIEITEDLHIQNRTQFFQNIDWEDEDARESVLAIWRQNRAFDGIYLSQDDDAWEEIKEIATQDWEYRYENVLGGTGNSFGVELEFEMPNSVSGRDVAHILYEAGILERPETFGYHSGANRVGPGFWRLERDGSLDNGLELVSPVLFDSPEHWQQIEKATKALREVGAFVNENTGGHVHIGIAPLDHRAYSWQRLARIGLGYEQIFYRMGGADSQQYSLTGRPGTHRGRYYTQPLPNSAQLIRGTDTGETARMRLGDERYTMFNATNVDASYGRKPTLEMRYPNGTLDHRQVQAQVIVANSVIHQAAVIRNDSPQSAFTPGLMDTRNHLRLNNNVTQADEETSFRKFLDVLGNQNDRLAATWLYMRGSV